MKFLKFKNQITWKLGSLGFPIITAQGHSPAADSDPPTILRGLIYFL